MKKLLLILVSALMLTGILGCSNNGGKKDPVEPEIKGVTYDSGRFSILVPEGWSVFDLGSMANEFTAVIIKGTKDDFMKKPQVSLIYSLPTELVVSSAALADDVIQQPDFDLGGYHWTSWTGSFGGLKSEVAETEGEFGTIYFNRQYGFEGTDEKISLTDPEVQAMLKSITVKPTTEVDWVKISNGKAVAQLPETEGMIWEDITTMTTEELEAHFTLEGNTLTVEGDSGSGNYVVYLRLVNEEVTEKWADGQVGLKIENGKVVRLYDARIEKLATPEEIGNYDDWGGGVDYDSIDEFMLGAWVDNANNMTMFIQKDEGVEHGYVITMQTSDKTIVINGFVELTGSTYYGEASVNGTTVETTGLFIIDGNSLLWAHDAAVGEYQAANIFEKVE